MLLLSALLVSVLCKVAVPATVSYSCRLSRPDFDSCLSKNIEQVLRQYKSEAPKYGLPTLEPLKIDKLIIPSGQSAVQLEQSYKNVEIHFSLANTRVVDLHYDPNKKFLKLTTVHPIVTQKADFSTKGQLLVIPINGEGPSLTKLYNMNYIHEILFNEVIKNGKKYLNIRKYRIIGNPEKVVFKFEGIFGKDQTLNDNINNVLNENWRQIWLDIRHQLREPYEKIMKDFLQRVLDKVPAEDIFPS